LYLLGCGVAYVDLQVHPFTWFL